ncbi:hypothetical protein ABW19_dt0209043 [Dactylella cylindrospora]|nr:hypothetical protein ABW19_dt0209043 [Dactylella cylindrospora]
MFSTAMHRALITGLLLAIANTPFSSSQTATLLDGNDYVSGRPCMRTCVASITAAVGCDYIDPCICRTDIQDLATSYLSTCIEVACSLTLDILSGISIYQGYCAGKYSAATPEIVPIATQTIIETTAIERETVEVTATVTNRLTDVATETVKLEATVTDELTNFITETVQDRATLTSITGTLTEFVPSSVTLVLYETYSTRINGTDALQQAVELWGFGSEKGLGTKGTIAVVLGVIAAVSSLAFIITLCCFLSRRKEMRRKLVMGGNEGWGSHMANSDSQ